MTAPVADPVALYRLYDAADALLYVGISANPDERWRAHACERTWWRDVARRDVEWHPSREAAARAEALAVRHGRPIHNRVQPADDGSPGYKRLPGKGAGIAIRQVRIDPEKWKDFGDALARADPGTDRSAFLRLVIDWATADPHGALAYVRERAAAAVVTEEPTDT